jgi:Asp-tRNA(Asn)/Glu-tRNA(Gln) amidotransferase A subunit family amidase
MVERPEIFGQKGVTPTTKAGLRWGNRIQEQLSGLNWQDPSGSERSVRFSPGDFIAVPTLQKLPPRVPFFGRSAAFEALVLDLQNTEAVSFAGNPALAIPIPLGGKDDRVTSLQLIGPRLSEAELLNAGRLIESK